jgi:myo-inositol-1(or 4)-monophosphatase
MKKYTEILEVIRDTRSITLPNWGNVEVLNQKNESAASVVTAIDEQVEKHLASAFAELMPEVSYVGEEFGGDRTAERFWLVDPVDGTGHYVHGLPYCTTMVAMIEHGKVVFCAIYDFVNDVMYHAEKGQGAFANETRLQVSSRSLAQAYVCYETKLEKPENLEKYLAFRKRCTALSHVCAGYEHVLVATGKIEGRIGFDPYGKDYDFAPGALLITEAGGVVTNIGSHTYDFTQPSYIAANPNVHAELTSGENALFPVTT